mgnify:CR=1 FL=1
MQILNLRKAINSKFKKSHILLFGSLLVFFGLLVLSFNHFLKVKKEVFSDMLIAISLADNTNNNQEDVIDDVPIANNINNSDSSGGNNNENTYKPIDYSKYLGVLEIPSIRLKRGFYGTDSKYNNIERNVAVVAKSSMPDVVNGNLILMGHSGVSYISYFDKLFKMEMGADMYITYAGNKYHYVLVNVYDVPKTGTVRIIRNYNATTLTLITCNKFDDTKQTVFVGELVS